MCKKFRKFLQEFNNSLGALYPACGKGLDLDPSELRGEKR
jgi:hypothetical protein